MSARGFGIRRGSVRGVSDAADAVLAQNAPVSSTPVTDALRAEPPGLHGDGEYWGLAWAALDWLEQNVQPGWSTLETGSGSSTLVFAARGAVHEAVTPDPGEEERIRGRCAELGHRRARR